jgi:hypothetical protein
MYSWVCASTPTVTRSSTGARVPCRAAASATRPISASESITIRPIPAATARSISASDLLLPCSVMCPGGIPARSPTASSPPEQVSRRTPSACSHRATAVHRNAFPA